MPSVGSYEIWMLAQAAMGFCAVGGMMFLVPAYVVAQGGSPADAGAVMAVAGALALSAPAVGNFADRFGIHRVVQIGSIALIAAAGVSFAYAEQELGWLVAASLLGLGMTGVSVVNATFVVGAGLDDVTQAKKLSLLQLSLPVGQVLGLATMSGLSAAEVSFRSRFLTVAGVAALLAMIVAAANRSAARRLATSADRANGTSDDAADVPGTSLGDVVRSQFGVVLLLCVLIMTSAQAIESQYPNYMSATFDIDPTQSAGALAVIVLISIPIYPLAGRWTATSGPRTPFLVSAAARAAAGAALLMLPDNAGALALVTFGLVMVVYPLFELNAATLAASTSPFGPGAGQGAIGAAFAFGTIVASVLSGWIADRIGFSSLATITLAAAGAALCVGALALRPAPTSPTSDTSTTSH